MIVKLKAKNPTSLSNLELLMKQTFNDINDEINKLEKIRSDLFRAQSELSCVLRLLQRLISLIDLDQKTKDILYSVFCPAVEDFEEQVIIGMHICVNHVYVFVLIYMCIS